MRGLPMRLTLLGRFTAASALVAAAFAGVLGWSVANEVTHAASEEAVATTAQAVEMLLGPLVVRGDFVHPLWPSRVDDLNRLVHPHLRTRGIVRVTLWNPDGRAIYSSDRTLLGQRRPPATPVRAALGGQLGAILDQAATDADALAMADGRILRVYAPVRLLGVGAPVGVYEVHRDARPLLARLRAARARVWILTLAGTVALYGSLLGLVRRASSTLLAQQRALERAFDGTVRALAAAVDAKDTYTAGHSSRVAEYARATGRALGLPEPDVRAVELAGHLHDVGKIGIPDQMLGKRGPLEPHEWTAVRQHALVGYAILAPVPIDDRVKLAVRHSHERWDGTGYPDRLRGDAIPIHARILAVADAYEAMISDRPYRAALTHLEAAAELRRSAGTQFDPRVVDAFLGALDDDAARGPRVATPLPAAALGNARGG
jgi:HD-GYP domain-containing protein (c-di-GMP phosphodiesterase class II)